VRRKPIVSAFDNSSTVVKKDTDATPWILFPNIHSQLPQWEVDRATGEALLTQYATVGEDHLLELAEQSLTAAARLVSNDSQLLRNLGRVYYLTNRTQEAIAVLQRANEMQRNDATTISLLALCYHRQKNTTQGIALFSDWYAQTYRPSMEYGLFADFFYQEGKHQKAIDLLQESLRANPTLTLHYRNLHIIQSRIGAVLEGQDNLRQAILLEQLTQPHLPDKPVANP
jgi:tetratricopeptide (TPR) repeat protein